MLVVSNEQMRKLLVALLVVVNVTFAYISWGSVCVPGPFLAASQARARPGCRSEAP